MFQSKGTCSAARSLAMARNRNMLIRCRADSVAADLRIRLVPSQRGLRVDRIGKAIVAEPFHVFCYGYVVHGMTLSFLN